MSESVLRVLIKLFILLEYLKEDQYKAAHKKNILGYLSRFGLEVSPDKLNEYYSLCYNQVYDLDEKRLKSSKITNDICLRVKDELLQNEKIFIIFCLYEYSRLHKISRKHTQHIILPLSENCNIKDSEISRIEHFIMHDNMEDFNQEGYLIARRKDEKAVESLEGAWIERNKPQDDEKNSIYLPEVEGMFVFVYIHSFNALAFKYSGKQQYQFRNTNVQPNRFYFFDNHDVVLKEGRVLFSYRLIAQSILQQEQTINIVLSGKQLEYNPSLSGTSIKRFTFSEKSGNLVGAIGESNQDKKTLFQLLAGELKPTHGIATINGFNTYHDKYKLQGVVGYIPENPLLFEELTLFENFYYHVKLHYRHIDHKQAKGLILRILNELGLQNLQGLRWDAETRSELGSYQLKLINLGIELIRDPNVVFFLEPFSGLQPGEIQKMISIFREMCMRGKLMIVSVSPPLFVNIREFDKVWIIDRKGYPVFNGKPEKAYHFFKTETAAEENIKGFFERKKSVDFWQLISEKEKGVKGEETETRKVQPESWHKKYLQEMEPEIKIHGYKNVLPQNFVNIPDIDKQFGIYFLRDLTIRMRKIFPLVKSVLFTVVLALLTGVFGRYNTTGEYVFAENRNMLFFIYASVLNAFLIGIWSGREEIRSEFEVVERDSILLLNKYSYLNAKFLIICFFSLLLTAIYTLLANAITGILYLSFSYWLVLSTITIAGVLVGLNLSLLRCSYRSLNFLLSAVVFLQIFFSGKVIPYQNFPEPFNNPRYVNVLGDLSVIRWGFEALVVEQFKNNKYTRLFYDIDKELSEANYELDFRLPYLDSLLNESIALTERENPRQELMEKLHVIQLELRDFEDNEDLFPFEYVDRLSVNDFNPNIAEETQGYITYLSYRYFENQQELQRKRKTIRDSINYQHLKNTYYNKRIDEEVTGKAGNQAMMVEDFDIIRNFDPIYYNPASNLGRAHLYAPYKKFNGQYVDTIYFNLIAILFLASLLYVFLMVSGPEYLSGWIRTLESQRLRRRRKRTVHP